MRYNNKLQEFFASLKRVGVKNSLLLVVSRFYDIWFDYKYKLDTVKRLELDELDIDAETIDQGQMYQPSGVLPFRAMLTKLNITDEDVFVDYGSGKGRTLIIAAMEKFKRVVGIEFSQELVDFAEQNINSLQDRNVELSEIENICCDASQYEFKDDETVFYFFFPFDDDLMQKVLDSITASVERKPRNIRVVYYYPVHASVIESSPNFKLLQSMNAYGYDCLIFSAA